MSGILKIRRARSKSPRLSLSRQLLQRACRRAKFRVNFDKVVHKKHITPLRNKPSNAVRLPYDSCRSEPNSFVEVTDQTCASHVSGRLSSQSHLQLSFNNNLVFTDSSFVPMPTVNLEDVGTPSRSVFKSYFKAGRKRKTELGDAAVYTPWTTAFSIIHSADVVSNVNSEELVEWMKTWSKKLDSIQRQKEEPPTKKRKRYADDDDDYEEEQSKFEEMENTYVVHGPTGCGKSSLVRYCLNKAGFHPIELSVSELRSASVLKKTLAGAIENFAVRKSNDIRSMFSAKIHKPRKTIILIDDADVIFQVDNGFWPRLNALRAESRIPIVLTCTDEKYVFRNLDNFDRSNALQFRSKPLGDVAEHLAFWFRGYTDINFDDDFVFEIVKNSASDVRKAVNTLQFYAGSQCFARPGRSTDATELNPKLLAELDAVIGGCDAARHCVTPKWTSRILSNVDYGNDSSGKETSRQNDLDLSVFPVDNCDDTLYCDIQNLIKQRRPESYDEIDDTSKFKSLDLRDRRGLEADIPLAVYDCFWRISAPSSSRVRTIATDELPVLQVYDEAFRNRVKNKNGRRVLHPFAVVDEKYGALDRNDCLRGSITSFNWPNRK